MGFLKKKSDAMTRNNSQSFYKRKGWKIFFFCLGLVVVFCLSFLGYLIAKGEKIFQGNTFAVSPLMKAIKGDSSNVFDQRVNIVLAGYGGDNHPGAFLTDSIEVLSIEPKDKKVAMISVPRDLYVPIRGHGHDKINAAFADGYNDYMAKNCKAKNKNSCNDDALTAGANLTDQTISSVLGIPIQYYVTADFSGFTDFINEIGGVDINVPKAIYDPFYPAADMVHYTTFKISAGQHHMDGALALEYARSRETTSDFDRSGRQQQILSAVKTKILNLGFLTNPQKLISVVSTLGDHVRTNFSPSEVTSLAGFMKTVDSSTIINKVLDTSPGGPLVDDSSTGTYYIVPRSGNFTATQEIAQNIFSTTPTMADEKASIVVQNGSSISGQGNKLATILENAGLNVTAVENAASKTETTTIYDYTGGTKKATLNYLQKGLGGANVVQKTGSTNSTADFVIIVGNDYGGFSSATGQ